MRTLRAGLAAGLVAFLLGSLAAAGEPVSLSGRSPHFGPMTGTLSVSGGGPEVEVAFTATFRDGTTWGLRGRGRISRGRLACDLYPSASISGAVAGQKPKATHKLTIQRDGSRYWGSCSGKKGTTWFREALSMTAKDPAPDTSKGSVKERLKAALTVLRRADANGDGLITGRRYGNELGATLDPLALAAFEFVDYGNYTGQTSIYGPATRGDVQEGGLGLGYTTRPKHYTSNKVLTEGALDLGMRDLHKRLSEPAPSDLPHQDLERVLAQAKTLGRLSGDASGQYRAIHEAAERLLEHIAKKTGEKERATNRDGAKLTHAELLAGLDAATLEAVLAKTILAGAKEQWMDFFSRGLSLTARDERVEERGQVGAVLQHYLLVVGKRAKETSLLSQIRRHLAQ